MTVFTLLFGLIFCCFCCFFVYFFVFLFFFSLFVSFFTTGSFLSLNPYRRISADPTAPHSGGDSPTPQIVDRVKLIEIMLVYCVHCFIHSVCVIFY